MKLHLNVLTIGATAWILCGAQAFAATKPSIREAAFGTMPDGTPIQSYSLENGKGMSAKILTYGAIINELNVPDAKGAVTNVVLSAKTLEEYLSRIRRCGCDYGSSGQSHCRCPVHPGWRPIQADRKQWLKSPARFVWKIGLAGAPFAHDQTLRRCGADLPEQSRRERLPRQPHRQGGLHPHRCERVAPGLYRDHRPGHSRQSDQPCLFQPLRRRHSARSHPLACRFELHACGWRHDPHRRNRQC